MCMIKIKQIMHNLLTKSTSSDSIFFVLLFFAILLCVRLCKMFFRLLYYYECVFIEKLKKYLNKILLIFAFYFLYTMNFKHKDTITAQ